MKIRAYAKINLSLRILGRRPDGYHDLESIMQSVSLFDLVTVEHTETPGITVSCDDPRLPAGPQNIAYKAAALYFRAQSSEHGAQNTGTAIHISKKIPMAAGLAGGSADAAAVLEGLNKMVSPSLRVTRYSLLELGAQLGSDVPFCLVGGTCLVEGRGERVTRLEPWPKTYFVLVNPDFHVSTQWVYEEFDRLHLDPPEGIKNDLEPVVVEKFEAIVDIKSKLLQLGCQEVQMSGSGPTVFGSTRHRDEAELILKKIKEQYPRSFLAETVDKGVEIVA